MNKSLTALALASLLAAGPAFAAEDRDVATVVEQEGSVTASTGGDFSGIAKGGQLHQGDRLMVVDGSAATLRFDNDCRIRFDQPGVFVVPDRDGCLALLQQAGAVDWAGAAKIATGVAIGALLLDSMDKIPPPPASR